MKMRYHGPGSPENEAFETTTDQGGRYQFPAIAVPDDEFRLMRTQLAFCVTKEGYDCTRADFSRSSDIHEQLDFRLEPDRNIELPAGTLRIPRDSEPRLSELNEPSYGFVFLNNQLEFAELDQESDFELHYAFVANGESNEDNLLGSTTPSKSGQAQFLASVHASKDRIGQVRYTRVLGHPPRMPAINAIKFNSVFSFHQPMEIGTMFLTSNEFLLKTRSGNYALLHFEMDRVSWVYQPDGSLDISRKRRK
ncbi:MAG: hypothetical protein R3E01_04910 [Pirellulaceae bacterium]|nr:hypothetical protein [Planctomycetales bacterium]